MSDCNKCKDNTCSGPLIKAKLYVGAGYGEVEVIFDESTIPDEFIDSFLRFLSYTVDSWKGWEELNKIKNNKHLN